METQVKNLITRCAIQPKYLTAYRELYLAISGSRLMPNEM